MNYTAENIQDIDCTWEFYEPIFTNHNFFNEVTMTQFDTFWIIKGWCDLSTCQKKHTPLYWPYRQYCTEHNKQLALQTVLYRA